MDVKKIKTYHGSIILVDNDMFKYLNSITWYSDKDNYCRCHIVVNGKRKWQIMHRIIIGAQKGQIVDHINGNVLDNRKQNLRICTAAENARNRVPNYNKKYTKYLGVYWHKNRDKYSAVCSGTHLGWFTNDEAAAVAYNSCAKIKYKEYARLNNVKDIDFEKYRLYNNPRKEKTQRKVYCELDGLIFNSIKEACDYYGANYKSMRNSLCYNKPNKYKLRYL